MKISITAYIEKDLVKFREYFYDINIYNSYNQVKRIDVNKILIGMLKIKFRQYTDNIEISISGILLTYFFTKL